MTYEEAIAYIENYTWSATKLGLERTFELLDRIGNPHRKLKFVHVTGSNGKGSTCAFIERVLREAGYRTGFYSSPHIQHFSERMKVNGQEIDPKRLAQVTELIRDKAEGMEDHPSQFEMVTSIAMEYFMEEKCDIVVLEVGMGGTYDSTNVIDAPEVAVITNIGLEHTEYLGDTLEKIASTKAGIIKPGCRVVCYDGDRAVTDVIRGVCEKEKVPLDALDFSELQEKEQTLSGSSFIWKGREYRIGLLGPHQLNNAAVAIEAVFELRKCGWNISDEALQTGLLKAEWPARFEVLRTDPLFILDGGHNPQCAEAMAVTLHRLLPGRKVLFLMGILADKEYSKVVEILSPFAKSFVCVTPDSPRALPGEKLAEYLRERKLEAVSEPSIERGLSRILTEAKEDDVTVAFGSLYMAGAVRDEMMKN